MDSKEQIIVNLKQENDYLKRENDFLKREFMKLTGTYPNMDGLSMMGYGNNNLYLPPINNFKIGMDVPNQSDTKSEIDKLKEENQILKKTKETYERQNMNLINENNILAAKLNNLENVFIGSSIIRNKDGTIKNDMGEDYNTTAVRNYFLINNKLREVNFRKFRIEKNNRPHRIRKIRIKRNSSQKRKPWKTNVKRKQ